MAIHDQEALNERAKNLGTLNGMQLVLVGLNPAANPVEARLEVRFFNSNGLASIMTDFAANPAVAKQIFPIKGGRRVLAGSLGGQVRVISIAQLSATVLELTVKPIGDYSVYALIIERINFDPVFSQIRFKFRPGCFNADCSPDWPPPRKAPDDPTIDYLSKDYNSFRHTMIAAMMQRVPGWRPTSEADLDQVLLELFSVAADELSDYQDRVMNEAYLSHARKRVSLARHARLMDYHIHQGNQANSTLALEIPSPQQGTLPAELTVWTGTQGTSQQEESAVFLSKEARLLNSLLNRMGLYTWSDSMPALEAGATTADLKLTAAGQAATVTVTNLINNGTIKQLLIQEWLNPSTGRAAGRNPQKRQLLTLIPNATSQQDPLTGDDWFVRVSWRERDKLKFNYCFTVQCPTGKVEDVSLFHGNLVPVFHGRARQATFKEPGAVLAPANEFHFERDAWGAICYLPAEPLAYEETQPGGEQPTKSTLQVTVQTSAGSDPWLEVISLIHSTDSDGHFMVETDEKARCLIRFGNGVNGKELPENAQVQCKYQVGFGLDGNVGADTLTNFDPTLSPLLTGATCWNPFDLTNGRAPEPPELIIRRVPEAYRYRQLRAITLQDYVNRAHELPAVPRAAAAYAWTGSWRTVRIAIDPAGPAVFDDSLREQLEAHLNTVRLIGEDLELRPPIFVPVEIHVSLCVAPDYWPQDVRFLIEQEFSDGFTAEGEPAFFHPDRWTFGQPLYVSQIEGALQRIQGVEHVISVVMKRWNDPTAANLNIVEVRPNEIIQVLNDPDHMEDGFIDVALEGGRQ